MGRLKDKQVNVARVEWQLLERRVQKGHWQYPAKCTGEGAQKGLLGALEDTLSDIVFSECPISSRDSKARVLVADISHLCLLFPPLLSSG